MARLLNIETDVGQRWVRLNFVAEQAFATSHSPWKWVELYLDNQGTTTFLLDERGQQHPLAAAAGLSADKPTRIPSGGSARFALIFPLVPEMQSFRYEAVLYFRWGPGPEQVERVQIKSAVPLRFADFR